MVRNTDWAWYQDAWTRSIDAQGCSETRLSTPPERNGLFFEILLGTSRIAHFPGPQLFAETYTFDIESNKKFLNRGIALRSRVVHL